MKQRNYIFSLSIIGILYFTFGFITWLNNQLIPFLKTACQLTDTNAYLVTFAFYISYFVMALPSASILKRTGFARGISLGLVVMALGCLIFIPAAQSRNYVVFLVGLFVQGTGLALLQTAANPYVTVLGPIESATQRMCIMGLFNKIAGIIGIWIFSKALLSNFDSVTHEIEMATGSNQAYLLDSLASRIVLPYIIMACALVLIAIMVHLAKLPNINSTEDSPSSNNGNKTTLPAYLWLGVLALFFYEGAEVMAIDTLVPYSKSIGLPDTIYSRTGIFALLALLIGYISTIIAIPKYVSQRKALAMCSILSLAFVTISLFSNGIMSLVFIILLSFSNAVMWGAIWALAIDKLGERTSYASALLIMAIVGGAIIPLLYGKLSEVMASTQFAYLLFIPCYVFVLFYSLKGYKIGKN
ncbi:MAG: sugar MFS transporter [Bacteroidales bacterium]|nr:sugar MFS transporter [Bacteroidales bacterium]MBQ9255360.1 sugar MFS transporter [Bacteroidales bacterium]